jgi:antirestriction protein ArdC
MPFSPRINALEAIRNYRARSVVAEEFRPAAVLVLIQETQLEHHVTLLERAATLCLHSGKIAFPGGSVAAEDKDALAAALFLSDKLSRPKVIVAAVFNASQIEGIPALEPVRDVDGTRWKRRNNC